jgi:glycosyltransferase involved in cell wall biosynthesis
MGGLPELIGEKRCVPLNDAAALAARMRELWQDPERRRADGEELLARARRRHGEARFMQELLGIYARLGAPSANRAAAQ